MIGIYAIMNLLNGKIYIGQSIDIEDRLKHHESSLKYNRHENSHLQNSWNEYGEDNFSFYIIQLCSEEELDELEIKYIRQFDATNRDKGYNMESGGSKNKHISDESRAKMSKAKIGMYDGQKNPMYGVHLKVSDEKKKRLSNIFSGEGNPMYGVHLKISDHTKKILSERFSGEGNPFYGRKHNDKTKEKMRRNNKSKKPIECVETGEQYESSHDAYRKTGIYCDSINKCCNGKQHTAGGFHWKFVA